MNIDDGEIRRIENVPTGPEEAERWLELKAEEVEPLINTPQPERPEKLAQMRGLTVDQIRRSRSKAKRRSAEKAASKSRRRNRR
jgi:hypothetical protein